MKKVLIAILSLIPLHMQAQQRIDLYPGKPELKILGAQKIQDVPHLDYYKSEARNRKDAAILVCPGGGYGHLALVHEGKDVAAFFNKMGLDVFVLHYRLNDASQSGSTFPAQYEDVTTAMRLVKSKAAGMQLNPEKIGVLGFSAGGHLASMLTTMHVPAQKDGKQAWEFFNSRPAFSILVYPVISMADTNLTHVGSRHNLLGPQSTAAQREKLSTQNRVDKNTPPVLLIHSSDDMAVPVGNSLLFYQALLKQGVPASMQIFDHGGHGYGMAPQDPVLHTWTDFAYKWIQSTIQQK